MLPATGRVLVASESLEDAHFARSVVYLLEHGTGGSMGLIINRALDLDLGDLWAECPDRLRAIRIAAEGGPVERGKGLLLHGELALDDAHTLAPGVAVGGNVNALAKRFSEGPDQSGPRLFLGHSGWSPGQLEREIAQSAWIVRAGDPHWLFDNRRQSELWERLLRHPHLGGSAPSVN